jgi:hypothetical protein
MSEVADGTEREAYLVEDRSLATMDLPPSP